MRALRELLLGVGSVSMMACGGDGGAAPSATAWAVATGPVPSGTVDPETGSVPPPPLPTPAAPAPVAHARPALPASPGGDLYTYRGTIGGQRAVVRLTCATTCSGYYFYEASGEAIALRATSDRKTYDTVVEKGDLATTTAKLAFDVPPGKNAWRGRLTSSGEAPVAPVVLARVAANGRPIALRRTLEDKSPKDAACTVSVASFELLGLRDTTMEWRLNRAFAPDTIASAHLQTETPAADEADGFDDSFHGAHIHCRIAVQQGGCYIKAQAKVVMLDDKLVSVAFTSDDAAGEAHPDYAVAGATVSLATGEVLDAHELLPDPAKEPAWGALVVPTPELAKAVAGKTVAIDYGSGGVTSRSFAWSQWPWKSFYLTPKGVALPPRVDEADKALRDYVQVVPYARAAASLRQDGSASYLWTARPKH